MSELLDFTMEMNADGIGKQLEDELFAIVDGELRRMADGHNDLTGAAATLREQAKGQEGTILYEGTVVAYVRPANVAASAKSESPHVAITDALAGVTRQIREKRDQMQRKWEQPGNDPVTQEIIEVAAAEQYDMDQLPSEDPPDAQL